MGWLWQDAKKWVEKLHARVDIRISPLPSETETRSRLFSEIFILCLSPFFLVDWWSALVVISNCGEEGRTRRGQLLDNWIQLRQTEYLILPFRGERVRQDWGRGWQFNNSGGVFSPQHQLPTIEPHLMGVGRILNPRVCHLCKKKMDDWGGSDGVFIAAKCSGTELPPLQHLHHFVHGVAADLLHTSQTTQFHNITITHYPPPPSHENESLLCETFFTPDSIWTPVNWNCQQKAIFKVNSTI